MVCLRGPRGARQFQWLGLAVLLALFAPALGRAQVNVPWILVGTAASESTTGVVELTANSTHLIGAMWNPCAINITQPFDLVWTINFGTNPQPCGSDGMAFVLQPDGTTGIIGADNGEHGYSNGNITNSLAVILDTFTNAGGALNDPPWSSLGIETNGVDQDAGPTGCTYGGWTSNGTGQITYTGPFCGRPPISTVYPQVPNGLNYTFEAQWNPSTYQMTIITTTPGSSPSTQAVWTLPSNYLSTIFNSPAGNLVYYGFTASTGNSMNAQQAALTGGTVNGVSVSSISCAPSPTPGSLSAPSTVLVLCGTPSPTYTPAGYLTPTPTPPAPGPKPYVYSNPSSGPTVRFVYQMASAGQAQIAVLNDAGNVVAQINDTKGAGVQESTLNIQSFAPGHYFYQVILQYSSGGKDQFAPEVLAVKK